MQPVVGGTSAVHVLLKSVLAYSLAPEQQGGLTVSVGGTGPSLQFANFAVIPKSCAFEALALYQNQNHRLL